PQSIYVFTPLVAFDCPIDRSTGTPIQTVHPNGTDGILLTNVYPSSYTQAYVEPRLSATYTVNPDTVLRASAGRYAQQPQNYEIQYNTLQPNLASTLLGFIPFGFDSPLHQAQAQFSNNYDFSYEHHFKGTDVAMKLTPYYRWATNQLYESVNLPSLNVSPSFNAGTLRVDGVELEVTKGDFSKNGFSGVLSYTYTNAAEKWNDYPNSTVGPVDQYIQDVQEFNALTRAGGGAPCYKPNGKGTPAPTCPATSIRNPYYNMLPQPTLDPHAWYAPGLDFPYIAPNTLALVLNYRHGKFAISPALSLLEGTTYGTPADVQGNDPRSCTANQGSRHIPTNDPLAADYTSCSSALTSDGSSPGTLYIPNPQTGTFDTFGQFRQPWQFNLGVQASYDFTPRISGRIIVTNLLNQCFGGSSEPWSKAYPPNGVICGYTSNTFYNGGYFYNGTSPNDPAANGVPENKYFAQSFAPAYGDPNSSNYPLALNLYFSLQVKL
ncbi:MAG: TonB-dependent receptor, partial [Candidatus Eremiobacteraeota bacterium]|nr:TonB-dependent receptor [Candidatus Eremiobacteraeota bacterium]